MLHLFTTREMFNILCLGKMTLKVYRQLIFLAEFKLSTPFKVNLQTLCDELNIKHRSTVLRALRKLKEIGVIDLAHDGKGYLVAISQVKRVYA